MPHAARKKQPVGPGDVPVDELASDEARAQASRLEVAYLRSVQATLCEWVSAEDAVAFDDL